MTSSPDDQGSSDGTFGQSQDRQAEHGQPYQYGQQYTQPEHAQPQQYGQYAAPQYGQPAQQSSGQQYAQPYAQQQDGQQYAEQQYAQPYSDQQYGQQYAQPQYAQPQHAQAQQYGQYAAPQYGQPAPAPSYGGQTQGYGSAVGAPSVQRPGGVITAAVLGFLFGALGVVATLALFFVGAVATSVAGSNRDIPGLSAIGGALGGIAIVAAVLVLAWTVVMIWGSVWALTGRSRVMLLVGGSIALALWAFSFFGTLADANTATTSSIIWALVLFLGSLAVVVLLSVPAAGRWFAARRAARGR